MGNFELVKNPNFIIKKELRPLPPRVGDTASYAAMSVFQDVVLDPEMEPGELSNVMAYYNEVITREGEEGVRRAAAQQEVYDRTQSVIQTVGPNDPALAADLLIGIPYRDTYLEERAIDNNWNTSTALGESLTPLEEVDVIADYQKKEYMVRSELERRLKNYGDASVWTKAGDMLGQFLFWNNINARTGLVDLEDSSGEEVNRNVFNPLVAQRISDEVYELMINTPLDDFPAKFQEYLDRSEDQSAIFGTNQAVVLRNLERLIKFTVPNAVSLTNLESTVDYLDVAGIGLGATASGARMARVAGNTRLAARLGRTNTHNNLYGAQQTTGQPNLTIANEIDQISREFQVQIINKLETITHYKDGTELDAVIANTKDTMEAFYPNRVMDVRWKNHAATGDPNWSEFVDVYIGTQKGTGFTSEAWATNQATAMGIRNFDVVQDVNTRKWLVHVEHRPTETRNVLGNDLTETKDSFWARYSAGARQRVDERTFEAASRAEMTTGGLAHYFYPFANNLTRLPKAEKVALNDIITRGLNTGSGKWFNDVELRQQYQLAHSRDPSVKEVEAYYSYKAISDMEWTIRNRSLRASLAFDNWREFSVSGNPMLARRVEGVPSGVKVHDMTGNELTPGPNDFIVQLADPVTNPQGGQSLPMKFIKIDRATDLKELPNDVLGYAEGGRRYYDTEYYIKQDRSLTRPDGIYIYNPNVLSAAKTQKEAAQIADALNSVSAMYKEWKAGRIGTAAFDAHIGSQRGLQALDSAEVDRLVTSGKWNPDKPFEALADGQLPSETARLKAMNTTVDYTSSVPDSILYTDRLGRMYYSPRGAPLNSLETGKPLETVNVYEAASRSMSNAIRTGAYNEYRIEAVNSWVKTAITSNALKNPELAARDPWTILKQAELTGKDATKLETLRQEILWNLDPSTVDSRFLDSARLRLREWLYDKDKPFHKYPGFTSRVEALMTVDPVQSLRGITFDRHLGMFGIDQLVAQSSTWMTASAIHGADAVKSALPKTMALRAIHFKQGWVPPRDFDNFIAHATKMFPGNTKQDLKRRLQALNKIDILNVGGEMAQLQMSSEYVHSSRVIGATDKVRRAGRVFFNWAEQHNRLVAFNIAYDKIVARGIDPTSDVGLRQLTKLTQDYSLNMTRSQTAYWQRGFPSLFTQFFGYMGRYIDAVVGKQFTAREKQRMIIAHSLLWGAAGVPIASNIQEYFGTDDITGNAAIDHFLTQLGDEGTFSAVLGSAIGTDVDAGARLDPMRGVIDILKDIYLEGPGVVFEIPAIDTLGQAGGAVARMWNLRYAGEHSDGYTIMAREAKDSLVSFVTPWNRYMRAYYILNTGRQVNRLGSKIIEDNQLTTPDALAALLGIQKQEVQDLYLTLWDNKARRERLVLPIAEQYAEVYNKGYWSVVDGNMDAYERRKTELEILMQPLNEDPMMKKEVLDEAMRIIKRQSLEASVGVREVRSGREF